MSEPKAFRYITPESDLLITPGACLKMDEITGTLEDCLLTAACKMARERNLGDVTVEHIEEAWKELQRSHNETI